MTGCYWEFHCMVLCKGSGFDLMFCLVELKPWDSQTDETAWECVWSSRMATILCSGTRLCVLAQMVSQSHNWRVWFFFFPNTAVPSPFYPWIIHKKLLPRCVYSAHAVIILGEIVDLLHAVTATCLMWQKAMWQNCLSFLLACKTQTAFLHVGMYRKREIMFDTLTVSGAVFVNGKEMTNQLPAVTSGSTVTFDMEVVQLGPSSNEGGNFKLRVTISSNNREVVFDWVLDQCCVSLYFGCSFSYPGWKVLVF